MVPTSRQGERAFTAGAGTGVRAQSGRLWDMGEQQPDQMPGLFDSGQDLADGMNTVLKE